jgi:hypothetical protein
MKKRTIYRMPYLKLTGEGGAIAGTTPKSNNCLRQSQRQRHSNNLIKLLKLTPN